MSQSRRRLQCVVLVAVGTALLGIALAQQPTPNPTRSKPVAFVPATKQSYLQLAGQVETMLQKDVLNVWFPASIDKEHGGFYSDFTRDWRPSASEGKFSVPQGRMTWLAAQIAMRRPQLREQYLPFVNHGIAFLNDVLWDKQYGGFFWGVEDSGKISPYYTDGKHLYGISFGIYGAAAAFQAAKDPRALELAKKAFLWTDSHAHDAKNGGYFEWLTRDGKVLEREKDTGKVRDVPVALFPIGYKSMNTHIHLLEAYAQLYEVWKDPTLRQRLEELLAIVRDKVSVEPGAMNLYFTNDWRAIPGNDSYGHDVEATYLMLEAEEVLGGKHDARTERMAKLLVDHALAYGWDENAGGFYREGSSIGEPEDRKKEWWVEFEALNSFLLLHEKYGSQTDAYFKAFQRQWQYIQDYQIDHEYGGVYEMIGVDGNPATDIKGRIWKAAYHDGRALLNVSERLRRLAEHAPQ